MTAYSYKIDLTRITYPKLLELQERFGKIVQRGGGYQDWMNAIEQAIQDHQDNPKNRAEEAKS